VDASVVPAAGSAESLALVPGGDLIDRRGTGHPPDENPFLVYLARLAPGSRKAQGLALERIARELSSGGYSAVAFPWQSLRYQHVAAIRARLQQDVPPLVDEQGHVLVTARKAYSAGTTNRVLSALRGVLEEAWRLGHMSAEDFHRARAVKIVKQERLPTGRRITSGEFAALADACKRDRTPQGSRDASIFAVLYVAGLRRSELVALDLEHWNRVTGELLIRSGKGGKDRRVFVANGAGRALDAWLGARGDSEGPLLFALRKGGRLTGRRMSTQAVQDVCTKRAREARVTIFTPHDLRRSFVTDLLDAGEDIVTVQRAAGHANVQTTARYDRRGDEALKRAAARLHWPW